MVRQQNGETTDVARPLTPQLTASEEKKRVNDSGPSEMGKERVENRARKRRKEGRPEGTKETKKVEQPGGGRHSIPFTSSF